MSRRASALLAAVMLAGLTTTVTARAEDPPPPDPLPVATVHECAKPVSERVGGWVCLPDASTPVLPAPLPAPGALDLTDPANVADPDESTFGMHRLATNGPVAT